MSLLTLLKDFAEAVMDRSLDNVHEAATALESHFQAKVEAPVEKVVAKVEAAPAAALAAVKNEVAATIDEVTK